MGSAVLHEIVEHIVEWPDALLGLRAVFEEGSELMGTLLCVAAITGNLGLRRMAMRVEEAKRGSMISRRMVAVVVGIALGMHLLISFFVVRYIEIGWRGNPAVWFFFAAFFILSMAHLQAALASDRRSQVVPNLILAAYFLAVSAGSMYFIMPRRKSMLRELEIVGDAMIILVLQTPLMALLIYVRNGRLTPRDVFLFAGLALVLVICWRAGEPLADYAGAGVFAFLVTSLMWPAKAADDVVVAEPLLAG